MVNQKVVKFTNLKQSNRTVLEYVRLFDQLSQYVPDMVAMEARRVWRFLKGLRPSLVCLVNIRKEGPKSSVDTVGLAIRYEAWHELEKRTSQGLEDQKIGEQGSSLSQFGGNWHVGGNGRGR